MDSVSSNELRNPERLKTLVCNIEDAEKNNLLHRLVLAHSDPNSDRDNEISAALRAMSDISTETVNALNSEGYSALYIAVLKNNLLVVNKLLFCFANIDVNKECGFYENDTALNLAAKLGHLPIIKALLNNGANINTENIWSLLYSAANLGRADIIEYLLNRDIYINITSRNGCKLLFCAAASGNMETVKFFVRNNIDAVNIWSLFYGAAKFGHLDIIHYLLYLNTYIGININIKSGNGCKLFFCAAASGNIETVNFLVGDGAFVDAKNIWSLLYGAAKSGHLDIVKYLLGGDIKVNIKSENGCKLLRRAVSSNDLKTVEFLIDKGADVYGKYKYDRTLLHYVACSGSLKIAEFLVSIGFDVNAKDLDHYIPLHYAVYSQSLATVEFFVNNGADVNAKDKDHYTPLHYAAYSGHLPIVKFLLSNNSDINAIGYGNRIPFRRSLMRRFEKFHKKKCC